MPGDDLLARFAVGLVSSDEHALLSRSLASSRSLAERLSVIRHALAEGRTPWAAFLTSYALKKYQTYTLSAGNDLEVPIRLLIREVGRRMNASAGSTWAVTRSDVNAGRELWTALVEPTESVALATARFLEDGTLRVTAQLSAPLPSLTLCLKDPVFGSIELATGYELDDAYCFEVREFAELIGMDRVAGSMFLFASNDEPEHRLGLIPATLPNGDPVAVQLAARPEILDGVLRLNGTLQPHVREQTRDCILDLQILVGTLTLPIASKSVAWLDSDEFLFEAPVDDVPDGVIRCGSIFRLRFLTA